MEIARNEKVLYSLNKSGVGVEIGPAGGPVAPKKMGFKTHVIDHLSKEGLIQKYQSTAVHLEGIEEVDFVWHGESYADLTGHKNYYDWVIASHVIEHTPDLIGFLNSCQEILKDDGILSLVIPDARFCFDHFRPLTGISKIIDCHLQKRIAPSPGTLAEGTFDAVLNNGEHMWNEAAALNPNYQLCDELKDYSEKMAPALAGEYVDCHNWCFTPQLFELFIRDLNTMGYTELKVSGSFPSRDGEFFVRLSKSGQLPELNRLDQLKKVHEERWVDIKTSDFIKKRIKDRASAFTARIKTSLEYRFPEISAKLFQK